MVAGCCCCRAETFVAAVLGEVAAPWAARVELDLVDFQPFDWLTWRVRAAGLHSLQRRGAKRIITWMCVFLPASVGPSPW